MPDDPQTDLPEALLQQFADRLLGQDPAARAAALQRLQAAHPAQAAALARAAADLAAAEQLLGCAAAPSANVPLPAHLGPYEVVRRLGDGAFGEVFLCRQQTPIQRDVAVKVLRPGAGDRQTLARFAAERQLLAALQHPTIAQVFDAGELPDGRPYLVMEYIDGTPLQRYCEQQGLGLAARLDLFLALCRGVQHAHGRGIVHRDLKPSNVLVVAHQDGPLPRIIDFGVAKLLAAESAPGALATEGGRVVGTPGYMSPEQAQGRSQEVDERADVYSLGVMLYELLCGELPWPAAAASTECEPELPSRRVVRAGTEPGRAPRHLAQALRGDLDWITCKCLRSTPAERYASVADLVQDLERHRRGEPVLAGPPSVVYRLRKFARRQRPWLLAAALAAVLGGGAFAASLQFRAAAATSEARRLADVLAAVDRLAARARDPRLEGLPGSDAMRQELTRDALALCDRALAESGQDDAGRALHVRCLLTMADICYLLGERAEGQRVAEAAVELARARFAVAPTAADRRHDLARALRNVGRFRMLRGDVAGAIAPCDEAIGHLEALDQGDPGAHASLLAKTLVERAFVAGRSGDLDGQLQAQRRAIAVLEAQHRRAPDHDETQRDLVRFYCGLANLHRRRGDADAADRAIETARELVATLPLVTDEERAIVSNRLGSVHAAHGRLEAAIAAFGDAVRWHEALLARHPGRQPLRETLALVHDQLCQLHADGGALAAAVRHGDAALATLASLPAAHEGRERRLAETLVRIVEAVAFVPEAAAAAAVAGWVAQFLPALDDAAEACRAAEAFGTVAAAARGSGAAADRLVAAAFAACDHAAARLAAAGGEATEHAAAREQLQQVRESLRR